MKTFKSLMFFASLLSVLVLTSCQKDQEEVPTPDTADTMVGEWVIQNGEAVVFSEGVKIFTGHIQTSGNMVFRDNGTGSADISMSFEGETDRATGPFNWERDGFELIIEEDGEMNRWQLVDDEPNLKTIQMTEKDPEEEMEIELTLTMLRK